MITIDGSQGEGGGQILRTSLALALLTGRPVRIRNIRARRPKPGLLRQHLTAVQAAGRIGGAEVQGAALGSTELTFVPGPVTPGEYEFDVGTAGSATLVLQTVLPPLLRAEAASRLRLRGGTHNTYAPPFDFLARTFAPLVQRMGAGLSVQLVRWGFYPAGGGEIVATVTPPTRCPLPHGRGSDGDERHLDDGEIGATRTAPADWSPLELLERGPLRSCRARAVVSKLTPEIGRREVRVVQDKLGWPESALTVEEVRNSPGPGNVLMLEMEFEHVTEIVTAFGERGVPAERVADSAVEEVQRYLGCPAPVGEHLADQLLLPLVLGGGAYRTVGLSGHTKTNIDVIHQFGVAHIDADTERSGTVLIRVRLREGS